MKPLRILAGLCAAALLVTLSAATSDAATGPKRLQRLAQAQTQLLFRNLHGQLASPPTCGKNQDFQGVYLLPTLSFSAGDAIFDCVIKQNQVLVDLGGLIASEDKRGDTYPLPGQGDVLFTRDKLEAICDDALLNVVPDQAPATLDGRAVVGVGVSTKPVDVKVNRDAGGPFYQDSIDLGHKGRLAASYCGHKALLHLTHGKHTLVVTLTNIPGVTGETIFTYNITVKR